MALTPDETILGLVTAQARHGYQLLEIFNEPQHLGKVWHLSSSQIYAVLKRLEKDGLIIGQQVSSENAPNRTEYMISPLGQEKLEVWLNEKNPSPSVRRVRVEFLSRLYIAQILQISTSPILNYQRQSCQAEYQRLIDERDLLGAGIGYLASDLVIAQLEAINTWIDHCELLLSPNQS